MSVVVQDVRFEFSRIGKLNFTANGSLINYARTVVDIQEMKVFGAKEVVASLGDFSNILIPTFIAKSGSLIQSATIATNSDLTIASPTDNSALITGNGRSILFNGLRTLTINDSQSEAARTIDGRMSRVPMNIFGNQGDDTIWGGQRNDHICGGEGKDTLMGEGGDDELIGNQNMDRLFGGLVGAVSGLRG